MVEVAAASGQLIRIHHAHRAERCSRGAGEGSRTLDAGRGTSVACTRRNCNATGGPRRIRSDRIGAGAGVRKGHKGTLDVYKLKVCNHIRACSRVFGSLDLRSPTVAALSPDGFRHPSCPLPIPDRILPDR